MRTLIRSLAVLSIVFAAACRTGDPGSVHVVDCEKQKANVVRALSANDGGFAPTGELKIHPGDVVSFTATGTQTITAGHLTPEDNTVPAGFDVPLNSVKCFAFDGGGEYGFHSQVMDGTIYVRSGWSETVYGILDFAALKWVFLILVLVMPLASLLTWAERQIGRAHV
jgi:hypothetical protein